MRKVLFVATVRSHIGQFHVSYLRVLKREGYEIHCAYRDNSMDKPGLDLSVVDYVYEIPFQRNPFHCDNIKSYVQLKEVIDKGGFDIIHCHTPVGGVLTRLAAIDARKHGTKVIYTAHGFHFFKGASFKNWLIYYPIEKILSMYTDAIITINREDYTRAQKFFCKKVYLIHGVGIDTKKFHVMNAEEKQIVREKHGYADDEFILVYPADVSIRKNQKMLIAAAKELDKIEPNMKYKFLFPGQPILREELEVLAKEYGVEKKCLFLGYRRDIAELVGMSDVMISSSRQEGLPVCIMEAMAAGKPVIATRVRGNEDLIEEGKNGFLIELDDTKSMAEAIYKLYKNTAKLMAFGANSREKIIEYSNIQINEKLYSVYMDVCS